MPYGIEKLRVYPSTLRLDLAELADAREYDRSYLRDEIMVTERSINPLWEDPVTMAVNAARPMLSEEEKAQISLLIVGTETSLDQEKALSSWVHGFLGLPDACRHFEVKCACYSGTAAVQMGISWLKAQGAAQGKKALVITTDQSLNRVGKIGEFVLGAGAVAMLLSDEPDFLVLEELSGIYAQEVSDIIRPLPWVETGNSEVSLMSYMESLVGAYENYAAQVDGLSFADYFDYHVYHVPFAGISYRAHKQLMQLDKDVPVAEVRQSFDAKTAPSLAYARRIGSTYGGSIFVALLSLVRHAPRLNAGHRIGVFSYGAGSCAEFYVMKVGQGAKVIAQNEGLFRRLDARQALSVPAYEALEAARIEQIRDPDFMPDRESVPELFEALYQGRSRLILKKKNGYYRYYEFV